MHSSNFNTVSYCTTHYIYILHNVCVRILSQEGKLFHIMESKAESQYSYRLLQKCFYAMRTYMTPLDTYDKRRRDQPFIITRLSADLEQLTKRFISHRKRMLFSLIKYLNDRYNFCRIRDAKKAPSFKSFVTEFGKDVSARIMMEQRLLLQAYENRGQLDFKDVRVPSKMLSGDGKPFVDPAQRRNMETSMLPPGFKISKVRFVVQEGMGIVGWQTVWSGDCAVDKESPRRGKWTGAGTEIVELSIALNDFVDALEYVYESSVITGIRLRTLLHGWTKWVGGRLSESASTAKLTCDMAPMDDEVDRIAEQEARHPGIPRSYITGFTGLQNVTRATKLGIVVRQVRSHNVFSYYWVSDNVSSNSNMDDNSVSTNFPLVTNAGSESTDQQSYTRPMSILRY